MRMAWADEVVEKIGSIDVMLLRLARYNPLLAKRFARNLTLDELARAYVLRLADSEFAYTER